MATLIRLKDAVINNPELPNLSNYGYMPSSGLNELIKLNGNLNNSVLGGSPLRESAVSKPTGVNIPSFANGIWTLPNANAAGQAHNYTCDTGSYPSIARTYALLFKIPDKARGFYAFTTENGVSMFLGGNIAAQWSNSTNQNRIIDIGSWNAGVWQTVIMAVDAVGVRGMTNNGNITEINFAAQGGAKVTTARPDFGRQNVIQSPYGDFAFIGVHNRGLDNNEMRSLSKGLSVFAKKKGIII